MTELDKIPVSAVILTKNEELLLPRCLENLSWADEVVVMDSGSTDRTREIAHEMGARVVEQDWLGYSRQRNAAANSARNDWIFFLDADEVASSTLVESIRAEMQKDHPPTDGFSVDRRGDFLGTLIPNEQRSSMVRSFVRLYNRRCSQYDESMIVHERVVVPGKVQLLDGILVHWRSESMRSLLERAARYTSIEAQLLDEYHGKSGSPSRVVVMPLLRMGWLLFGRGFIRLGRRGLLLALLSATRDLMRGVVLLDRSSAEHDSDFPKELVAHMFAAAERADRPSVRGIDLSPLMLAWIAIKVIGHSRLRPGRRAEIFRWSASWYVAGHRWEKRYGSNPLHPPAYALQL